MNNELKRFRVPALLMTPGIFPVNTFLLLASSVTVTIAHHTVKRSSLTSHHLACDRHTGCDFSGVSDP